MLILLVILAVIVLMAITIKPIVHHKKVKIERVGRIVKVDGVNVEYADLQHYIDTEKEFEARKTLYDMIVKPDVEVINHAVAARVPEIINHHIGVDVQNVHDNMIQKNLKAKFSGIFQVYQPFSSTKEEILNYITDNEKAVKIEHVLDMIEKRNAFVTNLDASEEDVIKNVWFSGNNNVKDQVINELLDCVDQGGLLYCPTGVTSRVTSSLHINDPDNAPKTKGDLKQEIVAKFGYHYNKLPDKTLAKEKTIDEYYGVYNREDIDQIISEWIEHI